MKTVFFLMIVLCAAGKTLAADGASSTLTEVELMRRILIADLARKEVETKKAQSAAEIAEVAAREAKAQDKRAKAVARKALVEAQIAESAAGTQRIPRTAADVPKAPSALAECVARTYGWNALRS